MIIFDENSMGTMLGLGNYRPHILFSNRLALAIYSNINTIYCLHTLTYAMQSLLLQVKDHFFCLREYDF